MAVDLKETLNLPKTDFPMRGNLVQREPGRIDHWEKMGLYKRIQGKNSGGEAFLLHDGPPFTNGDVHIGTALNKILKDIILRYKSMRGFRTPYVPGWDCHGLPIEHKVSREIREKKQELTALELRRACADFSRSYIEVQRKQFQRLGVLADWEREYRTMNPAYEASILRTFAAFVEQGLVYRSKKPVYWSIPCETALAEAEIEYQDHKSPSIWVKFPVAGRDKVSIVIWTTTPWTLPANLAIAVHPRLEYVEVTHAEETYIVAAALADSFIQSCGLEGATLGKTCRGEELENTQTRHPFIDRASPVVLAEYVTTTSGTGCVHTAPGHGPDDYVTGLKYGLEVYCPVDDQGKYVDDGQVPADMVGLSILEDKGTCPANIAVLKKLSAEGALLHKENLVHQYPFCWRSKTPVAFRALDQWFVSLDKAGIREKAFEAIEKVQWVPEAAKTRIRSAVETRPDWCISRQRSWGVPIPCFYNEAGEALLDGMVIRQIADKVEKHASGTDLWFEQEAAALLEGISTPANWEPAKLKKGTDTLDVWIDSGCSHRAVLQQMGDLTWPADVYLEGSDQHRGWFQSSLWTGIIADKQAPYRTVLTHGFVVNEDRRKISKSDTGKPQTSDTYVGEYGADIIRLWLSSENFRNDIPISKDILKQTMIAYRSIRNSLMYQLGNLHDFDYTKDAVPLDELNPLDQWALHQTAQLIETVTEAYESYQIHLVFREVDRFCGVTLSRIYHDILKDRLYTYGADWPERRSSQTAIYHIFNALVRVLAPIVTFTADEAFSFLQGAEFADDSIHLAHWPEVNQSWFNPKVTAEIDSILRLREQVNEKLEALRKEKVIGRSLDAQVTITGGSDLPEYKILEKHQDLLAELFIVSKVLLEPAAPGTALHFEAKHAEGVRCPRSWRWVPELVDAGEYGEVSPRDRKALQAQSSTSIS